MNITYIVEFGKLRYVHVTVNTYSAFLMASAPTREATKYEN